MGVSPEEQIVSTNCIKYASQSIHNYDCQRNCCQAFFCNFLQNYSWKQNHSLIFCKDVAANSCVFTL